MARILEREEAAARNEGQLLPHIRAILPASVHSTKIALTAALRFVQTHQNTHIKLVKELGATLWPSR
jgi:hypothetical protein